MGEIIVRGLGRVRLKGDKPSPEEEKAILDALKGRPENAPAPFGGSQDIDLPAELSKRKEALAQRPEITKATGGFVTRETAQMVGATGGGAIGAATTGPIGLLAGSSLGAAEGSLLFDTAENLLRMRKNREPVSLEEGVKQALDSARGEALFTGGAQALGPAFKVIKPFIGKTLLRVGKQEQARADRAENVGIKPGIIQVTPSTAVKVFSQGLGFFPFLGAPFNKTAARADQEITKSFDDILNTLAPNASLSNVGVDVTKAASARFDKFRRVSGTLYTRFEELASSAEKGLGAVKGIVPTADLVNLGKQMQVQKAAGQIILKTGETLKAPVTDPFGKFIDQLPALPNRISVSQARQLQRDLQKAMNKAAKDGFDLSRGMQAKLALEQSINKLDVSQLPAEKGQEIIDALTKANTFHASGILRFETATAKKFERIDKKIFKFGATRAGSINSDQALGAVFNAKSAEALTDLRSIVGPESFKRASASFLQTSFNKSMVATDSGTVFNPDKFASLLNLDSANGKRALAAMLSGSAVTPKQIENFIEASRAAKNFFVPEASKFLSRRFVLGGLQSVAGGIVMGGSALSNPIATAVAFIATKHLGKVLTSPDKLRAYTTILKDTTADQEKRALLIRLVRSLDDGE